MLFRRPLLVTIVLAAACSSSEIATPVERPTKPVTPPPPVTSTPEAMTVGFPDGWTGATTTTAYKIGLTDRAHDGKLAAYIFGTSSSTTTGASFTQSIRADSLRGKRIRVSAWVQHEDVAGIAAGLTVRIEGPGITYALERTNPALQGTADWHQIATVVDVPTAALGITIGGVLAGGGIIRYDDVRIEAVGTDVPLTGTNSPSGNGNDSVFVASTYAFAPYSPVNTNFEGIEPLSQNTLDWFAKNVYPVSSATPETGTDDLRPFGDMVGQASLVGLGEGTHGTAEFFRLKHRLLEYLVKEKGFTYFAIEATSPEADDVNRYVLTGEGDPRKLLSNLYFWTWNTQEVLDMVKWIRQWNSTAPVSRRVQFLGFDMQFPGTAMDSVYAYFAMVDPSESAFVTDSYTCINPYRNRRFLSGAPTATYAAQPETARRACASALADVYTRLAEHRAEYEARSSHDKFEAILHDARLVQQFEAYAAITNASSASTSRDMSMAENVVWIRDHMPRGAKGVLWAHNGHITPAEPHMGTALRAKYGGDYVTLGFAFGSGSFNSTLNGTLQSFKANQIPSRTMESLFHSLNKPFLLFDTRTVAAGGAVAAPLAGPTTMRSIGAIYNPALESSYFTPHHFPESFDLLLYVDHATASALLSFIYS
jgi:erythromycin esterase